MQKIKVSVLIPFYNHSKYIEKTLSSIRDDDYGEIEVIVIDDGSILHEKMKLFEIVNQYSDLEITCFSRENRGVSATLNELVDRAVGEYVIICASDDYLINNTITERVKILSRSKARVLIGQTQVVNSEGQTIQQDQVQPQLGELDSNEKIIDLIVRDWCLAGSVSMIDKSVFMDIGYFDESLVVEDWDFYLRASLSREIVISDLIVSAYRIHESNTHSSDEKRKRIFLDLSRTAFRYVGQTNFLNSLYLVCAGVKLFVKSR